MPNKCLSETKDGGFAECRGRGGSAENRMVDGRGGRVRFLHEAALCLTGAHCSQRLEDRVFLLATRDPYRAGADYKGLGWGPEISTQN